MSYILILLSSIIKHHVKVSHIKRPIRPIRPIYIRPISCRLNTVT